MKTFSAKCFLLCLLWLPFCGYAQYTGGTEDGHSAYLKAGQNAGPNIYTGSGQDGVASFIRVGTNLAPAIYGGGQQDGVALYVKTSANAAPNIYSGGNQDGVASASVKALNPSVSIYQGGNQDGVANFVITGQNTAPLIYLGGASDGVASISYKNFNQSPAIYFGGGDDGYGTYAKAAQNAFSLVAKFTGKWAGSDALLEWNATAHPGVDHFELARSADNGTTFTTITSVPAGTKTGSKYNYNHNDVAAHDLPADNVIYQLRAIAKDGSLAYAAVVRLDKDKTAPVLLVYPNPSRGRFTLGISNTENNYNDFTYMVTDAQGKALLKGNITSANTAFNLSSNAAGTYFLSVFKNTRLIQHFTIIVAR